MTESWGCSSAGSGGRCEPCTRTLEVYIGGPDGFAPGELDRLQPALRWRFGPLTLPHELAAVVAAEQFYRAWAILRKVPYHR